MNTADYDEEDEDLTSTEERLQPNLQTTSLGPRPLSHPILPPAVLKASSCEYLLDQPVNPMAKTMVDTNTLATIMPVTATSLHTSSQTTVVISASTTLTMTAMANTHSSAMTTKVPLTTRTCTSMDSTIVQTTQSPVVLPASTIISKEKDTTRKDKDVCNKEEEKKIVKTLPRPAKFIPPPPPPRRLLLTQTNLKTSGPTPKNIKQVKPSQNSHHIPLINKFNFFSPRFLKNLAFLLTMAFQWVSKTAKTFATLPWQIPTHLLTQQR